jgi:hypothetical protein
MVHNLKPTPALFAFVDDIDESWSAISFAEQRKAIHK